MSYDSNLQFVTTLRRMRRRVPDDGLYYLLVLHLEPAHRKTWSVYSAFHDFSLRNGAWEIRGTDCVIGSTFGPTWAADRNRWLTIHTGGELAIYLARGGVALVKPDIVKRHLPGLLSRWECAQDKPTGTPVIDGFLVIRDHSKNYPASARLAKGKLRMSVLRRDNYRCVICGIAANDDVHVQLDVHHIIPFATHGPTVEENLATLCKACHAGLEDYDRAVRKLARLPGDIPRLTGNYWKDFLARDNLVKGIPFDVAFVGATGP